MKQGRSQSTGTSLAARLPARAGIAAVLALGMMLGLPLGALAQDSSRFRRGDFNADGVLDNSDAIAILSHLYLSSGLPPCRDAGDANDDARIDMSDAVFILQFLLNGGRAPRAPWPGCGADSTADGLDCRIYEENVRAPCSDRRPADKGLAVLHLTNIERDKVGLAPLKHNDLLARAMLAHLRDMGENSYFSHVSLDGRLLPDRIDAVGYRWQALGENIAAGYTTPEMVLAGWMASSAHRANILSPKFRELGATHFHDPSTHYGDYWGQDFGTQGSVFPVVINLEAPSTRSARVALHVYGEGWAAEVQISNDASFSRATWQPFRSRWDWTLSGGAGVKTVHVKLRKGTEIRQAQDQIHLDG